MGYIELCTGQNNDTSRVKMIKTRLNVLVNQVQLKEMKCKLRNEQHEREQEQTHHVAMLRELQHMLGNYLIL